MRGAGLRPDPLAVGRFAAHFEGLRVMRRLLVALVTALGIGSAGAQALQLVDDRGSRVELPAPPRRIVSLLPSLTETVCALGACHLLVGVDRYSNHPQQVRGLPQMGGGLDANIEAIVGLKPDVVLMAGSGRGIQRLESLGLKVLALEPKDIADMRRVLELLARLLGSAGAAQVWQSIDGGIAAAARSLPPQARQARVYFEASRGPYAAGPRSFIGELLQRLGARNIIPAELGPFPLISPEFVVRADPDWLMVTELGAQELAQRPGWPGMRAMRQGRVCVFTPEQGDMLVRPGPRMAEAAWLMARCLAGKAGLPGSPSASTRTP
jgi:iron complex transport system substrate-binding protein